MSEHVPAWKKAGLAVEQVTEDTTIESASSTKDSKKRASAAASDDKDKKPPKRQKLPKDKRAPPPESDHLVYIKTFKDSRDDWKFNTNSQQWILKSLFTDNVPEEYDEYVIHYVKTCKGAARDRAIESSREIIKANNDYVNWLNEEDDEEEEKKKEEAEEKKEGEEEEEQKEKKPTFKPVDRYKVKRAHSLITDMTGEEPDVTWEPTNGEDAEMEDPPKQDFIVKDVKEQHKDDFTEGKPEETLTEEFEEAEKDDKKLDKAAKKLEKKNKKSKSKSPKQDFIVKDVKKQNEEDEEAPKETPAEEAEEAKKNDEILDKAVKKIHSKSKKESKSKSKSPKQDFIVKDVKKQNEEEEATRQTPAEEFKEAEKNEKILDKASKKIDKSRKAKSKSKK